MQNNGTAECVHSFLGCMETCAGHVCASQVTAQSGRRQHNKPILISDRQQARERLRYQPARGVLDPLVAALSDLQVVLSHLIMGQPA